MIIDIDIDIDKTALNISLDGKRQRLETPDELWDAIWSMCAREARKKSQASSAALRLIPRDRVTRSESPVEDDVVDAEVVGEDPQGRSQGADAAAQVRASKQRSLRDRIRQDGAEKVVDEVFDDAMVHLGVEAFRMTLGAVGAVQSLISKKKKKKKRTSSAKAATTNAPRGQETRIRRWAP